MKHLSHLKVRKNVEALKNHGFKHRQGRIKTPPVGASTRILQTIARPFPVQEAIYLL
jgi:hypothetical protein